MPYNETLTKIKARKNKLDDYDLVREYEILVSALKKWKETSKKKYKDKYNYLLREKKAFDSIISKRGLKGKSLKQIIEKERKKSDDKRKRTKTLMGFTYQKTHRLKKAADEHARKLRARGAIVKREQTSNGYKITYTF